MKSSFSLIFFTTPPLIPAKALDKIDPLWSTLFRVVDDIKESVRKAAQNALRALSKVIHRFLKTSFFNIFT